MSGLIIRGFHEDIGAFDLAGDKLAKCLIAQGPEHYMTHEGDHYLLQHYFADIDNNAYGRILFKTSATQYLHAVFYVLGTAGVLFSVYESPTFTHNASNAISSINRNRPYTTKTGALQSSCHTPDGSGAGTAIMGPFPVGAGGNPAQSGPGQSRDSNEWILKLDTFYLIEAQSLSDNNKVNIGMDYYWRPA